MTTYTSEELNNMKAEELRVIAKEIHMTGSWKAKKSEMIEAIEKYYAEQVEEEITEEEVIEEAVQEEVVAEEVVVEEVVEEPIKPIKPRKTSRAIILYNDSDEEVERFDRMKEAVIYVAEQKLANKGWLQRSLRTLEKFYQPNGKVTKSQREKYKGYGWYAKYAKELED